MKSATLIGGLATVLLGILDTSALGQRTWLPTRLPPSAPVRVASRPSSAPARAASEPRPAGAISPDPVGQVSMTQGRVLDPAYIEVPQGVVTDPCFPSELVVPCVPEPACSAHKWQFFGDFLWL